MNSPSKLAYALICCTLLALASPALGQSGGTIGVFSDSPGWSDCNLIEVVGAPNYVYVVHVMAVEANTAQFRVSNDYWGAFYAGENYGGNLFLPSIVGGTILDGGTITYVGCKPLPHLLVTMTFIPFVPTPTCTPGPRIEPDPILPSGDIEIVLCDGSTVVPAYGLGLIVNGDPLLCYPFPCQIATEQTSWGRIKAMYR